MAQVLNRTALYEAHLSLHARMVPFAGWEMPIQYEGILAEARAVRFRAGIFDVSHMGRVWVSGRQAAALLDWLTTANVSAMSNGRARYTLICTQQGGILDDVMVYRLAQEAFLLVCNAANREAVWGSLERWRAERYPQVVLEDRTRTVGMIALQGPEAPGMMERLSPGLPRTLKPFHSVQSQVAGIVALVGRTGYTGEDGFEVMPATEQSAALWRTLMDAGATPCGLGARDVLRLEAGLPLHGSDIDATVNPFEAGLERFVFTDKESLASTALKKAAQAGVRRKLVGFKMVDRGVPRHGYPIVLRGAAIGHVTSGGYSPTLDTYIGMGYVSLEAAVPGARFQVDLRGKLVDAESVVLPFYSRRRS